MSMASKTRDERVCHITAKDVDHHLFVIQGVTSKEAQTIAASRYLKSGKTSQVHIHRWLGVCNAECREYAPDGEPNGRALVSASEVEHAESSADRSDAGDAASQG